MVDLRSRASTVPTRQTADDQPLNLRSLRDGSLVVCSQLQALILEGRGYVMFMGTEDAPIDIGESIDDQKAFGIIDVASGTTVFPFWAQGVMATWGDSNLINFMIEVDRSKNRYGSTGTAFTPLNLRTDAPIASTSTCYRSQDADTLVAAAKSSGGSMELYRESIEINMGNAGDSHPKMEYHPLVLPAVVGPASVLLHFGAASTGSEPTCYANIQWVEVPSNSV